MTEVRVDCPHCGREQVLRDEYHSCNPTHTLIDRMKGRSDKELRELYLTFEHLRITEDPRFNTMKHFFMDRGLLDVDGNRTWKDNEQT